MKIIKFIPWVKNELLPPVKSSLPEWWKNGELTFFDQSGQKFNGMKTCIPFMEVMTSGYVIVTPFDIFVKKGENDEIHISWLGPEDAGWQGFIGERQKELGSTIPRPAGHQPNGFIWSTQWSWKTPKGYSTLVTHPFNRYDLPFTTLSAIIDSDMFQGNGNIPFFIKKDFTGTIPAGTPYAQLMPFKREKWKSWSNNKVNRKIIDKQIKDLREPEGSYKKRFWVKKEYS